MGRKQVERKPLPGPDDPAELPANPASNYDGVGETKPIGVPGNRPPIPSGNYTGHAEGARRSDEVNDLGRAGDGAWEDVGGRRDGLAQHPPEFAHLARASSMNEEQRRVQQQQDHNNDNLLPPQHPGSLTISTPSTMGNTPGSKLHFDTPSPAYSQSQAHNPWGDSLPESGILHAPPEQRDVYTPGPSSEEPLPSQSLERRGREQSASSANDAWAFEAVRHPPPPQAPAKGVSGPETPMPGPPTSEEPNWADARERVETPPLPRRSSERGRNEPDMPSPLMGRVGEHTETEENAWVDLVRHDSWDQDRVTASNTQLNAGKQPAVPSPAAEQIHDESGWESLAPPGPPPAQSPRGQSLQNLQPTGRQVSGVVNAKGEETLIDVPAAKPRLPPRPDTSEYNGSDLISDWAPAMPPRPPASNSDTGSVVRTRPAGGGSFDPESETGSVVHHTFAGSSGSNSQEQARQTQQAEAKKEVYNIKTITLSLPDWPPTQLPILTQNANGPCPLLALVNAIVISKAEGENEVAHYLKGKEQISLELLLEALLNELFSGRYEMEGEFVDPGELHEFLRNIATGMNVNPRFVPKGSGNVRDSIASEGGRGAGAFTDTKELKLYAAFDIPLLHGWLPTPDSPAYAAFKRRSQTHEDAQLLLLQQEALEAKLNNEKSPLSDTEAETLQDITVISQWFASNSTQLTSYGLSALQSSLKRGEVGILFRNDHFSTIIRHPSPNRNGLFCLVSDEGYASESNVVFESLTDVDGSGTELFDGSFSRLSGAPSPTHSRHASASAFASSSHAHGNAGLASWPGQAQGRRHISIDDELSEAAVQAMAQTDRQRQEQEDADLAFAMRLEEEENARREREETAARRAREERMSADVVRGLSNPGGNTIPITRPGGGGGGSGSSWTGAGAGRGRVSQGPVRSMLDVNSGPSIPARRGSGYQSVSSPNLPAPNTSTVRPVDPEAGVEDAPPSYEQAAAEPAYVPTPANESRRASIRNSLSGMGQRMQGGGLGGRGVPQQRNGNGSSFGGVPLSPTGALATPYGRDPTPQEIERERARRRARGEDDRECAVM